MGRIILVLLARIDSYFVASLKQSLEQAFHRDVEIINKAGSLGYAYDASRGQYISPRILSRLQRIGKKRGDKLLGVVDVDMYSPDYEFVFGEAHIKTGVATVSLYRLRAEYYGQSADSKRLQERLVKESIHELGHLYRLGHCNNPDCVMHFSTHIADVDRKRASFCPRHQRRLFKS